MRWGLFLILILVLPTPSFALRQTGLEENPRLREKLKARLQGRQETRFFIEELKKTARQRGEASDLWKVTLAVNLRLRREEMTHDEKADAITALVEARNRLKTNRFSASMAEWELNKTLGKLMFGTRWSSIFNGTRQAKIKGDRLDRIRALRELDEFIVQTFVREGPERIPLLLKELKELKGDDRAVDRVRNWARDILRLTLIRMGADAIAPIHQELATNSWNLRMMAGALKGIADREGKESILRHLPEGPSKELAKRDYDLWSEMVTALSYHANREVGFNTVARIYLDAPFPTSIGGEPLSIGTRWWLVLSTAQNLRETGLSPREGNIRRMFRRTVAELKRNLSHSFLAPDLDQVIIVTNRKFASLSRWDQIARSYGIPADKIVSFVGTARSEREDSKILREALGAIRQSKGRTTLILEGHGGKRSFTFKGSAQKPTRKENLFLHRINSALSHRLRSTQRNLRELFIFMDSCYNFHFVRNLRRRFGEPPLLFTTANVDQLAHADFVQAMNRRLNRPGFQKPFPGLTIQDLFFVQDDERFFKSQYLGLLIPTRRFPRSEVSRNARNSTAGLEEDPEQAAGWLRRIVQSVVEAARAQLRNYAVNPNLEDLLAQFMSQSAEIVDVTSVIPTNFSSLVTAAGYVEGRALLVPTSLPSAPVERKTVNVYIEQAYQGIIQPNLAELESHWDVSYTTDAKEAKEADILIGGASLAPTEKQILLQVDNHTAGNVTTALLLNLQSQKLLRPGETLIVGLLIQSDLRSAVLIFA